MRPGFSRRISLRAASMAFGGSVGRAGRKMRVPAGSVGRSGAVTLPALSNPDVPSSSDHAMALLMRMRTGRGRAWMDGEGERLDALSPPTCGARKGAGQTLARREDRRGTAVRNAA